MSRQGRRRAPDSAATGWRRRTAMDDYKKLREEAKPYIKYEKDRKNRIAYLTFNRPDMLNAANIGMRQNYAELIHEANADDEVKVLVIRGEGKHLGARGDLPEQSD